MSYRSGFKTIMVLGLLTLFLMSGGVINTFALQMPNIDGTIDKDEYENSLIVYEAKFELYWTIDNDSGVIYFGIVGYTLGWVAIGIDPTTAMRNADMYFGYVDNGVGHAIDAYSDGITGPHPKDTDKGGTNDILDYAVTETSNSTIFEFSRKLDTGDTRDNPIKNKTTKVIWALGPNDDWNSAHGGNRGGFSVNFFEKQEGKTLQTSTEQASFQWVALLVGLIGLPIILNKRK